MPFISGMISNGVAGELASTVPPITGPAWGTAITGKNPGKHGVFSHTKENPFDEEDHIPVSNLDLDSERIWNILNR